MWIHPPKKQHMSPQKGPFQKERFVFAPPFFRRHVSFRVSTSIFTLAVQVDHKNSRELHQRLCLLVENFNHPKLELLLFQFDEVPYKVGPYHL